MSLHWYHLRKERLLVEKAQGHTPWCISFAPLCADLKPAYLPPYPLLSLLSAWTINKRVFYQLYRYYPPIYIWLSTTFRINPPLSVCFEGKAIVLRLSTRSYASLPRADRPTASCQPFMNNHRNRLLIRRESRPCHHGLYAWRMHLELSFFLSRYLHLHQAFIKWLWKS